MRDFRDAKAMARSLRAALKAKAIETTHSEALELIAKVFGYKNWNILSAKIEAAEPKPSDERWLSRPVAHATVTGSEPIHRRSTRDSIAHPARLATKDIGYEQRGFHWDIAQGAVPAPIYTHHIPKAMSEGWHANPNGKFVIGELRYSWRDQFRVSGPKIIDFGKIRPPFKIIGFGKLIVDI